MKKKFLMISTLAAVFFGSCVSENENPAPFKAGETVEAKFRVGLESSPGTRSSDGSGYSNVDRNVYSLRYKVAVYAGDKSSVSAGTLLHTDSAIVDLATDTKMKEFSFHMTVGTTYTVLGWADFVETANPIDKFYDTQSFPKISLKDAAFTFNEEAKDAYFGVWSDNLNDASVNVPLKRPFGKIRFLVSDYGSTKLEDADRTALRLSTEYYQNYVDNAIIYTTLNLATGEASDDATSAQRALYSPEGIPAEADRIVENGELVAFWDYIPAPSADQLTAGTAKPRIEFHVNYSGTIGGSPITPSPSSVTYEDPRIVVERNKLTTVRADLFGDAPTLVRLSIEDAFDLPELEPLKVIVRYTDGGTGTISIARDANGIGSFRCPNPVRAITVNGRDSIFIGTARGLQTVTLKFVDDKTVGLRGDPATSTPIPVNSIAELELIKTDATRLRGHYVLEADVDLLSMEWSPIGPTATIRFRGTFDGAGHTIRNLKISSGNNVGFFGITDGGVIVKNLGVSGNVTGSSYAGGIVGQLLVGSSVTACSFNGKVRATASGAGGIAGVNTGAITACHTDGAVEGMSLVGGLVGLIQSTTAPITACYSTATVTGTGGSLYGSNLGTGNVTGCFATTAQTDVTEFGDGVTVPGSGWPLVGTHAEWGIGLADGSGSGNYWKDLGSWNGGTNSVYPKLWWEK